MGSQPPSPHDGCLEEGDVACERSGLETDPMLRNLSATSIRYVNIRPRDLRLIKSIGLKLSDDTTLEIDNHADTCVVGKHSLVIYDYEQPVSIQAYDPALGTQ